MKGSEASSLMLILSSFCPVPVSLHLPRWHRTITSQRYFLNVSSGAERFPAGALAARVRGRDPRDRPCRAATQENSSPRPGGCRCQSWQDKTREKSDPDEDSRLNIYCVFRQFDTERDKHEPMMDL
ncbi:hypothetical protein PAMP_004228 [Pampus punctatissimus]